MSGIFKRHYKRAHPSGSSSRNTPPIASGPEAIQEKTAEQCQKSTLPLIMLGVFLSILIMFAQPYEQPHDLLQSLICYRSVTSYSSCCWLSVGHFWTETTSLTLSLLSSVCGSRSSVVRLFLRVTIEKSALLCKLLLFVTLIFSVLGVLLFGALRHRMVTKSLTEKNLQLSLVCDQRFQDFDSGRSVAMRQRPWLLPPHGLLSTLLGSVCLENILVGIVNRHSTSYDPAPVQPSRQLRRHRHGKLPP